MKNIFIISLLLISTQFSIAQSTSEGLVIGKKIEKQLKANESHTYTLQMDKNRTIELTIKEISVDLAVDILDVDKKKVKTIDTTYVPQGLEHITFTAPIKGKYSFIAYPSINTEGVSDSIIAIRKEKNQGKYEIINSIYYTEKEYNQKLENIRVKKEKIISWLKQNASPLKSVNAESGFEDLMPLKEVLKDVQIVGLGEATHGTKEFFQMKHRMLEFLVKEAGFTVFAMESSYAGCININNYVLFGKGDAKSALASQGFWTWNTEEVLEMIEWVRRYNLSVPDEKKVKFIGFDIQCNHFAGSFTLIKNYLKKVDPQKASDTDSLFKVVGKMDYNFSKGINTDSCKNEYMNFIAQFSMSKGDYVQNSSEKEYDSIFKYINVIGQNLSVNFIKNDAFRVKSTSMRDYYMASNFNDIVQHEKPNTKIVVWAHNAHISKFTSNKEVNTFGSHLKESFGDKYFAFGFSFNKGSFQAMKFSPKIGNLALQEFTIKGENKNSLDWYLSQTGHNQFIINFKNIQIPNYMQDFVEQNIIMKKIGTVVYGDNLEIFGNSLTIINKSFDALIFIDNTTRAISLK